MSRLTTTQQRALLKAYLSSLPQSRKNAIGESMRGGGFMDVVKSIGSVLGPIAKEIGPTIFKELLLPMIKKKIEGGGLNPAGGTLRLAGQRGKGKKLVKGSLEAKLHMAKLRALRGRGS